MATPRLSFESLRMRTRKHPGQGNKKNKQIYFKEKKKKETVFVSNVLIFMSTFKIQHRVKLIVQR